MNNVVKIQKNQKIASRLNNQMRKYNFDPACHWELSGFTLHSKKIYKLYLKEKIKMEVKN